MKSHGLISHLVVFLTFFLASVLCGPAAAATKTAVGYCGYHGRIIRAGEANCKKQHGIFFRDRREAQAWLAGQQSGFCCLHDRVAAMKKGACEQKKGVFFRQRQKALGYCDQHRQGFCCLGAKVVAMEQGACKRKNGRFFPKRENAARFCAENQPGFCCLHDRVAAMKKGVCKQKKGVFFKGKKAAAAYCRDQQRGFCCQNGKITSLTRAECAARKGQFSRSRPEAEKTCAPRGWCLVRGRVFQAARAECRDKKGKFFKTRAGATRAVKTMAAAPLAARKRTAGSAPDQQDLHARLRKPMQALPAKGRAVIGKIFLKNNTIQVQIRKQGKTPPAAAALKNGSLSLVAGKVRKSWPLTRIDPKKSLSRGKPVFFNTGINIRSRTHVRAVLTTAAGTTDADAWLAPLSLGKVTGTLHRTAPAGASLAARAKPLRAVAGEKPVAAAVKPIMGAGPAPKPATRRIVPKSLEDHGIRIIRPTGAAILAGTEITVEYLVTTDVPEGGQVRFYLRDFTDNEWSMGSFAVPAEGSAGSFTWRLPRSLATDSAYFVHAIIGETWGRSDYFRIVPVSSLLKPVSVVKAQVELTPYHSEYTPDAEITVIYRDPDGHVRPYSVWLAPEGIETMGDWIGELWLMGSYAATDRDLGEYRIALRLPGSDTLGSRGNRNQRWRIVVVNENSAQFRSRSFAIHTGAGSCGEGSASETSTSLELLSPVGGDYIPDESDMRQFTVRWRMHGPEGSGPGNGRPFNWRMEFYRPGSDRPVYIYPDIHADHSEETGPTVEGGNHTWTMRKRMLLSIPVGEYSLRISGGGLTADSNGTFFLGHDPERPELVLASAPAAGERILPGDTINVTWMTWPAPSDGIRLYNAHVECDGSSADPVGAAVRRDQRTGVGYRLTHVALTIDPEAEPSRNCRVVVRSRLAGRPRAESDPFTILPGPADGVDLQLIDLRLSRHEEGHLVAGYKCLAPEPQTYRISFYIGAKSTGTSDISHLTDTTPLTDRATPPPPAHWRRISREISCEPDVSPRYVDLGHISTLVAPEERNEAGFCYIFVRANTPETTLPERDFSNNEHVKWVPVWPGILQLRNAFHSTCYGDSGEWLAGPNRFHCIWDATPNTLRIRNDGYTTVRGRVEARLTGTNGARGARPRPIDLGSHTISVAPLRSAPLGVPVPLERWLNRAHTDVCEGEILLTFHDGAFSRLRELRIPVHCD